MLRRFALGGISRRIGVAGVLPSHPLLAVRFIHSGSFQRRDFKLTDIGEGIVQVEVMKWFIKPGDKVKEFDPLLEVQSDKATVEITSRFAGRVKKLAVKEGEIAKVGEVLVVFEDEDASISKGDGSEVAGQLSESAQLAEKANPHTRPNDASPHQPSPTNLDSELNFDKVLATPAVRHLARENKLDLKRIKGSGKDGRVMKDDVLRFIAAAKEGPSYPSATKEVTKPTQTEASPTEQQDNTSPKRTEAPPRPAAKGVITAVPITGIRKEMAKTMTASLRIPHLGYMEDIEVDEALKFADKKRNLTLLSILIKATSLALVEYPELNAHCNEDATELKLHSDHNVGIAMDTPRGLYVPVIHDVGSMSILDIAKELNRLKELGQNGKLGLKELSGSTISLSNIGSIGGTYASPVIVPPQVAIAAFGRVKRVPVFENKNSMNVKAVQIMPVSWSADHRVIDGASIARFCATFKYYVEHPGEMLLKMH